MNIIPLFCQIDDAFIACEKQRIPSQLPQTPDVPKKRGRPLSAKADFFQLTAHVSHIITPNPKSLLSTSQH